jgi:hypothetical protein
VQHGPTHLSTLDLPLQGSAPAQSYTLTLRPGWNAVGFSARPASLTVNPSVPAMALSEPSGYRVEPPRLEALGPGRACWLFAQAATTLAWTGEPSSHGWVDLTPGWNLVALPGLTPIPGDVLRASADGQELALGLAILPQVYEIRADGTQARLDLSAGGSLTPGRPCWIFSNRALRLAY